MADARRFTDRQRAAAFLSTGGLCALCGSPLDPDDFHVDHIVPWSGGGSTKFDNGQAVCPKCNQQKGAHMLLRHQQEFQNICREMKASTAMRLVLAWIVCGAGKSVYPVIAAHELIPTLADGLAWASPRVNLRTQAEDAFQDTWLRSILGHNLELRAAVNEVNPLRGLAAYSVTYDALVSAMSYNTNPHIETFNQRRMGLVLDEPNHIALDSAYHRAIAPLVERAAFVIFMGGHFSRHDKQRLAFFDYLPPDAKKRVFIDLKETPQRRVIKCDLGEGTGEHQLINIEFVLRDCGASWEVEDEDGDVVGDGEISSFEGASPEDTSRGLFTALKTEFVSDLLKEAAAFWMQRKTINKRSKLLVICSGIGSADTAVQELRGLGIRAEVAHSDDDASANTIRRFRGKASPETDVLVTVNMAYEGMNCPQADVLACLTRIRSREWIEQAIHRVTRNDRRGLPWDRQFATIFAPKDRFFRAIMEKMRALQAPYVVDPVPIPPPPPSKNKLRAVESEMTAGSAHTFDNPAIDGDEFTKIDDALVRAGLRGAVTYDGAKRFWEAMSDADQTSPPADEPPDDGLIPSERERALRKKIEDFKRQGYNRADPVSVDRIQRRGRAIWKIFNKPIEDMTTPELRAVWNARDAWMQA